MFAGILYGLEATLVFCLPTRSRIRKTGKGNLILALELLPSVLMQNDILRTDCRAEAVITSPMLLLAEPPAELVRIAYEPLQDAAPQVVDLLHVVPLLRAETYN